MREKIEFGAYLQHLRNERGLPLRIVAEKLGIDISMISKIEHGERRIQSHLLKDIAELYEIDFKEVFIEFLSHRIENEFGQEPFYQETLIHCLRK